MKNSLKYNKRHYPYCAEIPQLKPNLDIITKFMEDNNDKWADVYQAHGGLTMGNTQQALDTYKSLIHLPCTGPSKHDNKIEGSSYRLYDSEKDLPDSSDERHKHTEKMGNAISVRDKLRGRAGHLLDERNWGEPLDHYKDTEFHKYMNSFFEAPIIRLKYSKMYPGGALNPHIDYNTTYAVRFIIPIDGCEDVENIFWDNGKEYKYYLEPGKVYFLNIGYKHAVYHKGNKERRILLGSLGGQEDIETIRYDK